MYVMLNLRHSRNCFTLEKVRCKVLIVSRMRVVFLPKGCVYGLLTSKCKDGGNAKDPP